MCYNIHMRTFVYGSNRILYAARPQRRATVQRYLLGSSRLQGVVCFQPGGMRGGFIVMDLMDKLASLAQRYEELNRLIAQPEVLEDISLLQRYGREHAELEEVVSKYHELVENDRQI